MCSGPDRPLPVPVPASPTALGAPAGVSDLGGWTLWATVPLRVTATGTMPGRPAQPSWTRARVAAILAQAWPPATVRTLARTSACPTGLLAPVRRWAVARLAATSTDDDLVLEDTVAALCARGAWPATAPETRAIAAWVSAHAAHRRHRPGVLRGLALLAHWVPTWSPRRLRQWLASWPQTPTLLAALWDQWLCPADAPWHATVLAACPGLVNSTSAARLSTVLAATHPAHPTWHRAIARAGTPAVLRQALATSGLPSSARAAWVARLARRDPPTFVRWVSTRARDRVHAPSLTPRQVARWLRHPDATVRAYAIQAIAMLAPRPSPLTPTAARPLGPRARPLRVPADGHGRGVT